MKQAADSGSSWSTCPRVSVLRPTFRTSSRFCALRGSVGLPRIPFTRLRSCALAGDFLPVDEPQTRSSSQRQRRTDPVRTAGSSGPDGNRTARSPLSSRQNQLAGAKRFAPSQRAAVRPGAGLFAAPTVSLVTPNLQAHRLCAFVYNHRAIRHDC